MLRAKMRCDSIEPGEYVRLSAVYSSDPDSENYSWSQATPSGQLNMYITNPEAQGKFEVGKEYYIDISPAE